LAVRLPGPVTGNVRLPFSGTTKWSSTATGAWPVLMMMSSRDGVTFRLPDDSVAWYWM
jgi:hypothetical protein